MEHASAVSEIRNFSIVLSLRFFFPWNVRSKLPKSISSYHL